MPTYVAYPSSLEVFFGTVESEAVCARDGEVVIEAAPARGGRRRGVRLVAAEVLDGEEGEAGAV